MLVCTTADSHSLTVALLDWHGNPAAATFCRQHLLQTFQGQLQQGGGDVEASLAASLQEVDEAFLACPDIPDKVKAVAGASCSIAHLDLRQQKLFSARVGRNSLVLGQLLHGLAAQLTEGCHQFPPGQPANGMSGAQLESLLSSSASLGIGDGRLKSQQLAGAAAGKGSTAAPASNRQLGPVQTACQQLTVIHEHIVLGSAGLWAAISASDAALLGHFVTKADSVAVGPGAGGQPSGGVPAHVAAPLIQYARTRFGNTGLLAGRRAAASADAAAVVITLRWPATSLNQAFPAQRGAFLDALREQQAPNVGTPAGRARLRWRRARMLLVEFVRARRRALRQKWRETVAAALAAGKQRALEVEKLYWARHQAVVRVTPSGVVTDANGKPLMPTAIPLAVSAA